MSDLEIARGYLSGSDRVNLERAIDPRKVIEDTVLRFVATSPCVVSFSGGRDSSAVLAIAVAVARKHGLPAPVALTSRVEGDRGSDETAWQELVVRHLGIAEWIRIDGTHMSDLLGPPAQAGLAEFGVVWPPMVHGSASLARYASGGSLLLGEGGDEVLGAGRSTAFALATNVGNFRNPAVGLGVVRELMPRPVRARNIRTRMERSGHYRWLKPEARREFFATVAHDQTREPLLYRSRMGWVLSSRIRQVAYRNFDAIGARHGAAVLRPLIEPRFVGALAHAVGRFGLGGRSEYMRFLFGDLLPDAILTRRQKAEFNGVAFGPLARDFASTWSGSGLREDLIDVDVLLDEWSAAVPHGGTAALLQQAWLTANPQRVVALPNATPRR